MSNKKISVVIPSVNGLPYIKECLESLYKQKKSDVAEIVVVDNSNDQARKYIKERFVDVKLVCPNEKKTIPELRSIGIKESKSDIIAMIEDHCLVPENWFEEILKAHQSVYVAIGGAVENVCREKILDWASFFCEYSLFLQPVQFGIVKELPGNNISYKRKEMLQVLGAELDKGFWEGFLHQKLMEHGYKLFSTPSLVVYHKKTFSFVEFMQQRFYFSRSYAAMRNHEFDLVKRLILAGMSLFLPILLITRLFGRLLPKERLWKEFILSVPYLSLFTVVWAVGESWGYLFGAGESLSKIK